MQYVYKFRLFARKVVQSWVWVNRISRWIAAVIIFLPKYFTTKVFGVIVVIRLLKTCIQTADGQGHESEWFKYVVFIHIIYKQTAAIK